MWLLLACSVPTLTLPVQPPEAKHATALPATRLVGPWTLDAPCDVDAAVLLEQGAFAWRVVTWDGQGARVGDLPLADARKRWEVADESWSSRCGARDTEVLFAVDGRSRWAGDTYVSLTGARRGEVMLGPAWLLVGDADPVDAPAEPLGEERGALNVIERTPTGWAVSSSDGSVVATETPDLAAAAGRTLVGTGRPLLPLRVETTWADLALLLDAFAGHGALPTLGAEIRAEKPPILPPPPADHTTRIALDDDLPALRLPSGQNSYMIGQAIGTAGP